MYHQPLLGFDYHNKLYCYGQMIPVRFSSMFQYPNNFSGHPVQQRCAPPQQVSVSKVSNDQIKDQSKVQYMDLHANNENHDKDTCKLCRKAMAYLLAPSYRVDIYPKAFKPYSLFDQNLKLFDSSKVQKLIEISNVGFKFAPMNRFSTGFQFNPFDESIIGGINLFNETASNGETTSEFDEIWIDQELSIDSPFKPKVNSTFEGNKLEDSTMNSTAWKQPVVFDPSLSLPYNNAFPSLDSVSYKKDQEKHVVRSGNGVSKKTRK